MRKIETDADYAALLNGTVFMADGDAFQITAGHALRTGDDQAWSVAELKDNGFWPIITLWEPSDA